MTSELITDDEAALYDRQIRLWGAEAQKRLRQANVLVAGINGVGSEIIKNLVLAGINSITLVDDKNVDVYDTTCNLFTRRLIGQNKAVVASKYVQALNPMVKVNHDCENICDKNEEFFKQFHVVCLCGFGKETMIKVNNICNKLNIKFYASNTWGMFGYGFVDLGHNYTFIIEEMNQQGDVTITSDPEPIRKKVKTEEPTKQVVEKTLDYVPIETALSVKSGKSGIGLTKRTNCVFIMVHIMFAFYSKFQRYPSSSSSSTTRTNDSEELLNLQNEIIQNLGLDISIMNNCCDWYNNIYGELSPVCSIVGGVIGQDIIRSVCSKDSPIRNFFLFNGVNYSGVVESIGK